MLLLFFSLGFSVPSCFFHRSMLQHRGVCIFLVLQHICTHTHRHTDTRCRFDFAILFHIHLLCCNFFFAFFCQFHCPNCVLYVTHAKCVLCAKMLKGNSEHIVAIWIHFVHSITFLLFIFLDRAALFHRCHKFLSEIKCKNWISTAKHPIFECAILGIYSFRGGFYCMHSMAVFTISMHSKCIWLPPWNDGMKSDVEHTGVCAGHMDLESNWRDCKSDASCSGGSKSEVHLRIHQVINTFDKSFLLPERERERDKEGKQEKMKRGRAKFYVLKERINGHIYLLGPSHTSRHLSIYPKSSILQRLLFAELRATGRRLFVTA